jgi:hypothetical protein
VEVNSSRAAVFRNVSIHNDPGGHRLRPTWAAGDRHHSRATKASLSENSSPNLICTIDGIARTESVHQSRAVRASMRGSGIVVGEGAHPTHDSPWLS